jgi:hypothetical protein
VNTSSSFPTRRMGVLIVALALGSSTSCATLEQLMKTGVLSPPKVTFLGAQLVRAPSQLDLSAYYCPKVLAENAGLGFAANFLCSKFFGKAPAASDMLVGFDLKFDVANPNQLPLPLSEILTAITVFPEQSKQNLGAVCLALCEPGDTNCAGGARSNGCAKAPGDIKSMSDFPQAAVNLLIAQGIGAAGGKPAGFTLPKVTAASNLAVTARLALTPEAFLPALEELARRSVGDLKAGKKLAFDIPYRMEGTVFADGGSLGRVAAGFGPTSGAWPLPTERLMP